MLRAATQASSGSAPAFSPLGWQGLVPRFHWLIDEGTPSMYSNPSWVTPARKAVSLPWPGATSTTPAVEAPLSPQRDGCAAGHLCYPVHRVESGGAAEPG